MADKIVQLIDKDGDNIFPVSTVPNGAQITMTDIDPGEGVALASNNYIGVYGEAPLILDYSTDEIDTGIKWIDGKTIYKKTVSTGALPNSTSKNVAHNIVGLHRVIKLEGYAYDSGASNFFPLPYASATASNSIAVYANSANIRIITGTNRTSQAESYVTLYYTKS